MNTTPFALAVVVTTCLAACTTDVADGDGVGADATIADGAFAADAFAADGEEKAIVGAPTSPSPTTRGRSRSSRTASTSVVAPSSVSAGS